MDHPRWSWGTLAAMVTVVAALGGLVVWVFGFLATEREFKAHLDHDNGVQQWNQYGFAANRLEYLDDKGAECEAKRLAHPGKLDPADASICARYEVKLKAKTAEAADLKTKAMEATKEKTQ
jgi:hypothetical protein